MNKSLKRFLLLFALICVFVCGTVFAVACTDGGGSGNGTITGGGEGGDGEETVTYSVTVTTESNVDITTLKVQWMSGTTEASEKIALSADGKASAELDSGNYTVVLSGYDTAKYTAENASVTATAPGATIVLTAKTHTVTVVVTNSTGVDIPADVKVQLYNGTQTVGSPVALTQIGAAITGVPYGSSYTVGLIGLPDYFAAVDAKPVGDESTVTFELTLATVDYKINVAVTGEDAHAIADTLTVAFYKDGTVVEGLEEVEVKDGVATASLLAGAYTVKVNGLDAAVEGAYYECDDVTVSVTEHTATVTLTKIIYTITLEALPVNIQADAIANLKVKLGSSTEVAFAENKAEINAPAASYSTVTLSGVEKIDGALTAALTAENRESGLRLGSTDSYTKNGDYVVTTDAEGRKAISVTGHTPQDQPEVTELLYTFKWEVFGSGNSVAIGDTSGSDNPITFISGEISYILKNEQPVTFRLDHTAEGVHKFILKLTIKDAPAKGDIMNPIEVEAIDGVYTLPEGSELKAAYFRLPTLRDTKTYDLKVGDGVEIYSLGTSPVENPPETLKVENGGSMNLVPWDMNNSAATLHNYIYAKLSDTAAPETVLTFEVELHIEPGASPVKPKVLQLDVEAEHTFPNDNSDQPVWFSFTPSEAGDYRFSEANNNPDFNYKVYGGFEGEGATATGTGPVTVTGGRIPLEGSHTYYIAVDYIYFMKITVTISKYVALPGEKDNPIEVSETGETPNTVSITVVGADMYFKHTITADSLNADGDFILEFEGRPSMLVSDFYKDATYSGATYGETLGWDNEIYSITISGLNVGDVVYFTISTYEQTVTIYINRPEAQGLVLELDTPVSGPGTPPGPYDSYFEDVFTLVGISAGDYDVTLVFDPETYGTVKLTAGSNSVNITAPAGSYSIGTGKATITIAEGVTTLTVRVDGIGSATPYTITISKSVPKLTVDSPLSVDISGSSATIALAVPAGSYQLAYDFGSNVFMADIIADIGGTQYHISTPYNGGQTGTLDIEIGDGVQEMSLTINDNGGATTLILTLTATGSTGESTELTVGEPLDVQLTPESYVIDKHITLGADVTAGEYTLTIVASGLGDGIYPFNTSAWTFTFGANSYNTATGNNTLTTTLNVTIPDGCTELVIHKESIGMSPIFTLTLTKAGSGPVEPEDTEITVGKPVQVTLTPDGSYQANLTLTLNNVPAGTYNFDMSLDNDIYLCADWYVVINGTQVQFANYMGYSGPVQITIPDGCTEISITGGFASPLTATVTLTPAGGSSGPVGPQESDITVGKSAEVVIPSGYDGVSKTVYLEAGTYTITVTYENAQNIVVADAGGILGDGYGGTIIEPGFDTDKVLPSVTAQIEVENAGLYTLTFIEINGTSCTITVLIEEGGEESEEGDLTLGKAGTVTLTGIGSPEEVIVTIQLEEGWYDINIEGDVTNLMVVNSLGDTIVNRSASGEFSVDSTGLFELTFRYFGTTPLSLTVTITAQ